MLMARRKTSRQAGKPKSFGFTKSFVPKSFGFTKSFNEKTKTNKKQKVQHHFPYIKN
jgi:hypothetical protein